MRSRRSSTRGVGAKSTPGGYLSVVLLGLRVGPGSPRVDISIRADGGAPDREPEFAGSARPYQAVHVDVRQADIDAHYARGGRRVVDAARAAWVAVAGVREGGRREMGVKERVARQWQGDRREDVLVVVEVVAVQAPRAYDGLPGRDSAGVAAIVARRGAA